MDKVRGSNPGNNNITEDDLKKLLQLIRTISYGSITMIIQDGLVIQIETNEKIRLK